MRDFEENNFLIKHHSLCHYLLPQQFSSNHMFQDYYKIQQNIWKCIWMRFGNRLITGGVRKPVTPADEDYDTVD